MTSTDDPFTLIYQKLWAILTGFDDWADAVRAKMQFDQVAAPGMWNRALGVGDAPMVALLQGQFQLKPFAFDTGSCDMTLSFPLVIVGADLKVVDVNGVKWQTVRAIHGAGPYLGIDRIVLNVSMRNGADNIGDPSKWAAGHVRVTSMLTIDVRANIASAEVASGEYTIS